MVRKNKKDTSLGKHAPKHAAPNKEFAESSDLDRLPEQSEAREEVFPAAVSKDTVVLPVHEEDPAKAKASVAGSAVSKTSAEGFVGFTPSFEAFSKEKKHRGRKVLKVFGIILASLLGLVLVAYAAGCFFFIDRFWPNTTMGDFNISMKSLSEAAPILDEGVAQYTATIKGQGISLEASAAELGLSLDSSKILVEAVKTVKPWLWPLEIFKDHDVSENLTASYNKTKVEELIRPKIDEINATATQPTNATIVFDAATKFFRVVPEEFGTALDLDATLEVIDASLLELNEQVTITEDHLVQPTVKESNSMLTASRNSANNMLGANLTFTLAGSSVAILDSATIAPWIVLDEDLSVAFDEVALNGWIDSIIAGCNTKDKNRTYTRPDGKVITVDYGSYGWEIDGEAFRALVHEGISVGQTTTIEIPAITAGTGFDAIGGRDWGLRYCDIDLSEQYARFYDENGVLVWESAIISGRPDGSHNTPTGVYVLNLKESPSKLIGEIDPKTKKPEYETYVKYWMPFVGNAVGLHDATWQPSFGGAMYANGYGSHGCVNLPYSAAEALFSIIIEGDVVVCHW